MTPFLSLDSLENCRGSIRYGVLTLYINKLTLLFVVVSKRLCLFVINSETSKYGVGVVVLALNKGAAAIVANPVLLRL